MNQAPLYVFSTVCALACLVAVWQTGPHRILDWLRERLLALRFSLFEVGLSGTLNYNSDVYRTFESLLNALLRYAHNFPSSSYVIAEQAHRAALSLENDYAALLVQRIKGTEPDVQVELTRIYNDMQRAPLMYVASVPPLALLFGTFSSTEKVYFPLKEVVRPELRLGERSTTEEMTDTNFATSSYSGEVVRLPQPPVTFMPPVKS